MQVENNYDKDVYNGDLGVLSRIDMEEGELRNAHRNRKFVDSPLEGSGFEIPVREHESWPAVQRNARIPWPALARTIGWPGPAC
jgi:hypothetical protein